MRGEGYEGRVGLKISGKVVSAEFGSLTTAWPGWSVLCCEVLYS